MKTDVIQKIYVSLGAIPRVGYFAVFMVLLLLLAFKLVQFVVSLIAIVLILNGLFHVVLATRNLFARLSSFFTQLFSAIYRLGDSK